MTASAAPEYQADYASASSLLCAVISLCATQLARERSRVRPRRDRLDKLESYREDAIRTLRGLDPAKAEEVSDRFAIIYLGLIADEPPATMPAGTHPSTPVAG